MRQNPFTTTSRHSCGRNPNKVIDEDREKKVMWVYCSGADSPKTQSPLKNIVLYDYQPSRAAALP